MPNQTLFQLFTRFLRFGCLAWGGPVAQIAMIKRELVEEEQWISKEQFNRVLAVYQALPGPEAHELCVYFGMISGGRWGGFLAGLGFMLPGLVLMLAATWLYVQYGMQLPAVAAIFGTIQAAVIGLIGFAVYRIGKHALVNNYLLLLALLSALLLFLGISFYVILLFVGLFYALYCHGKMLYTVAAGAVFLLIIGLQTYYLNQNTTNKLPKDTIASHITTDKEGSVSLRDVFLTGLKGGLFTFGGAYTAIPFIRQDAVIEQHWLSERQFLDGLAISGILPAPLVIFATFVGYFGGGYWGALLITLGMFLPAFAFTLIGFNTIERLINYQPIHHFLDGITAAVVGIIASTACSLALATLVSPLQILLCFLAIMALMTINSKFTAMGIIIIAGFVGWVFHHTSLLN